MIGCWWLLGCRWHTGRVVCHSCVHFFYTAEFRSRHEVFRSTVASHFLSSLNSISNNCTASCKTDWSCCFRRPLARLVMNAEPKTKTSFCCGDLCEVLRVLTMTTVKTTSFSIKLGYGTCSEQRLVWNFRFFRWSHHYFVLLSEDMDFVGDVFSWWL